jgi:hypothetical protein
MEVEREYSTRLGLCLTLLREINKSRRLGDWTRADTLLQELRITEVRV